MHSSPLTSLKNSTVEKRLGDEGFWDVIAALSGSEVEKRFWVVGRCEEVAVLDPGEAGLGVMDSDGVVDIGQRRDDEARTSSRPLQGSRSR